MKKEAANVNNKKKPLLFKFGIGLLIIYVLLWAIALIIPFTPVPTNLKAILIPGFIIVGEILFLIGGVLVGKEVVTKYKRYLNPKNWRRRDDRQKHEQ